MPLAEILTEEQRKRLIWKRIVNLLVSALILLAAATLFFTGQESESKKVQNWLQHAAKQAMGQYKSLLTLSIEAQDEETLLHILQVISTHPHVMEVSLFDKNGVPYYNQHIQSVTVLSTEQRHQLPQVFVEALWQDNTHLGYIRLVFDGKQMLADISAVSAPEYVAGAMFTITGLIIGFWAARRFFKWKWQTT